MSNPPPPGRRPSPATATAADPIVQRLFAAQRVHGMYPANNPNVAAAYGRLREALGRFAPGEGLQLDIERDRIRFGELPVLPQQAEVTTMAGKIYVARVTALVLLPEVTDAELSALFDLLRMAPEERQALGHWEDILPARGVRHLMVREAGRTRIEEVSEDADQWDLATLTELEELESNVLGQYARTDFQETLRAVTGGQHLRASRMIGMLERPRSFAQYLVDLSSRVRPSDRVDLNAQIAVLEALLAKMAAVLDRLPEPDRIHLYSKLDQVAAWLSTAIHKSLIGQSVPPFARTAPVAALFPERLRDLDLREAFSSRRAPGPALAPVLLAGLRRVAAGDGELAGAFDPHAGGAAAAPAPRDRATYHPARLPAGSPGAPPMGLPADYLLPAGGGPAAAQMAALGRAAAGAEPALDLADSLLDLMALTTDPAAYESLGERFAGCYRAAIEAGNLPLAGELLAALAAEGARVGAEPALKAGLDRALAACGAREPMQALVAALARAQLDSPEQRAATELCRALGAPAIGSLMEILAVEPARSTRRRLLDLLCAVGGPHRGVIAGHISHPEWYVVRNVVLILGTLGPEALPTVLKAVAHDEPRVRREVARALATLRGPEATAALSRLADDRDESVLREAVGRLLALRDRAATSVLARLAQSTRFPQLEAETIELLARALAAAGDPATGSHLERLLEARGARGWPRAPEAPKQLRDAVAAIRARATSPQGGTTA